MDIDYKNRLHLLLHRRYRQSFGSVVCTANGLPYTDDLLVTIDQATSTFRYDATNDYWHYQVSTTDNYLISFGHDELWHLFRLKGILFSDNFSIEELAITSATSLNPYQGTWTPMVQYISTVFVHAAIPFALWSIDNGAFWRNDSQEYSIQQGTYIVTFHPVENYVTPSSQTLNLAKGETKTLECTYTPITFPSALLVSSSYGGASRYCGTYTCQGNTLDDYYGVYVSPGVRTYFLSRFEYSSHGLCWCIWSRSTSIYGETQLIIAYAETDRYHLPTQVEWKIVNAPSEYLTVTEVTA